jgi:DNA-binding MarR family transcriptional regulator
MSDQKTTKRKAPPAKHLVARIDNHMREMAAQTVVTSQIVAGHFKLHTTDLRVLDLIYMRGQALAGELAKATGLTSGSVTALIDRLEKAGYVERHDDETDRRKVWVRSRPDAIGPIAMVFAPSQVRMFKLWSTFSASELEVIADFLVRTTLLAAECAEGLRGHAELPAGTRAPSQSRRRGSNSRSAAHGSDGGKNSFEMSKNQRRNHDDPRK